MFIAAQYGIPQKLDDNQNREMCAFMRDMMQAINGSQIACMESYHSMVWDRDAILDVIVSNPGVKNWSVHAPYGRCFDPSSPDEQIRQNSRAAFLDAVYAAGKLGAGRVIAHPGADIPYDVPRQTRLDLAVETLKFAADAAGEHGIQLAVEPLPKEEVGNTVDELLEIVHRIDRTNVGVNFDVNHLFPPEAIPGMIRKVGDLILSVHISDQDGEERHWLPFEGAMNWAEVLAALVDVGYKGPLVYEAHIKNANSCDDVVRIISDNYRRLVALAPENG